MCEVDAMAVLWAVAVLCFYALWLCSVAVLCGCALWLCSVAVLCGCALAVLCGCALWLCSGCALWLCSVAVICGCALASSARSSIQYALMFQCEYAIFNIVIHCFNSIANA